MPTEPAAPVDPFHVVTDSGQLASRSARGAIITLATQSAKLVVAVASTTTLARLLTPADYGIIGMSATLTQFVAMFKDLGLSAAIVQREEVGHQELSTLFWLNLAMSAALAVLTAAAAPLAAAFYGEARLTPVIASMAAGFVIAGLSVQHDALLRRQMKFGLISAIELIAVAVGFGVAAALGYLGYGYWALVASNLTMSSVTTLGSWSACRWVPGRPRMNKAVGEMLRFGGNLTGFSVINYFARNADNVLIGRVWGSEALGYYDRAYQLLLLPITQVNTPLTSVAVPLLSRLARQPERYRATFLRVFEKLALVTAPAMMMLALTSESVVLLLLGERWLPSAPIFALLGLVGLIQPLANATGWLYLSQGRAVEMFRWGLVGGTATVCAIALGVPWGPTGVAASYAICGFVLFPFLVSYATRGGAVEPKSIYRALGTPVMSVIGVALLLTTAQRLIAFDSAWLTMCVLGALAAVGAIVPLLAFARGRATLADCVSLLKAARLS